ncbi:MAG: hypothetical protein DI556_21470 [Rhodovulum sulfidophilum]|uniref:Bile acid:sodium symporter n=1 Tax=Rhodovulum sulfidophilum TaxID=35806 RepID=A0A2W5Q3Q4_RHOSU|nr:MAG: hypothetical protein DI556_21470 [Rhodovulum sulfidophilum]
MLALKRLGIDNYMLLLCAMVIAGALAPARGVAAEILGQVTFWAVALLFFLYGAKLDTASVRAGLMNLRLQALCLGATYLLFPVIGLALVALLGEPIGPELALGILFLAVLPSTVQSSIAFTGIAGGNVAAAICAASLSNLVAIVLTPALMALTMHRSGGVSGGAVVKIGVQILLPFLAGQLSRPWLAGILGRAKRLTLIVDRTAILLIVYAAFSAGTAAGLWSTIPGRRLAILFATVLVFLALAMGAMILAGRVFGLPAADRATLFFCGSTKSLASGLPISTAIFPPSAVGAIVLPLMLFHLSQLLVCALVAQRTSRRAPYREGRARA